MQFTAVKVDAVQWRLVIKELGKGQVLCNCVRYCVIVQGIVQLQSVIAAHNSGSDPTGCGRWNGSDRKAVCFIIIIWSWWVLFSWHFWITKRTILPFFSLQLWLDDSSWWSGEKLVEFYTKVQCTVTASELPTDHDNSGVFSSTVHYGQGVFMARKDSKLNQLKTIGKLSKKTCSATGRSKP